MSAQAFCAGTVIVRVFAADVHSRSDNCKKKEWIVELKTCFRETMPKVVTPFSNCSQGSLRRLLQPVSKWS